MKVDRSTALWLNWWWGQVMLANIDSVDHVMAYVTTVLDTPVRQSEVGQ